jgi:hypothetical protein
MGGLWLRGELKGEVSTDGDACGSAGEMFRVTDLGAWGFGSGQGFSACARGGRVKIAWLALVVRVRNLSGWVRAWKRERSEARTRKNVFG